MKCKAKVQVTVEAEISWCDTDKTVDQFFERAARDAINQVTRGCYTFARVVEGARCVLVVGEPQEVNPNAQGTLTPKETP